MNKPIEWRLARAFVRCYSLLLFVSMINYFFGQFFQTFFGKDRASAASEAVMRAFVVGTVFSGLIAAVVLWSFSDRISDKLTKSSERPIEGEPFEPSLDLGIGLAGLIFLINGLKALAGDAVAWYFINKASEYSPNVHIGAVSIRDLATNVSELILGLFLLIGAKPIARGIMKLRSMPSQTMDKDTAR